MASGTGPYVIGFLNGMSSLIRYGLTACFTGGFGSIRIARFGCNTQKEPLATDTADGELTFTATNPTDASSVVDELALLLTGGDGG